uniref:Uncharacterized protein n=1 Tax=Arundo donax TaxID=35708 RepID=A0A0A9H4C4_ARUDO
MITLVYLQVSSLRLLFRPCLFQLLAGFWSAEVRS